MNSISGIGGQYPLSINGLRSKDGFREEELVALAPPIAPPPTFKADAGYDHQSEQAYEEAFAKLRVNLQNRAESDGVESGVSQGRLSESLGDEDPAVKAFREYMAMTPAEKMRDAILKELGLTEEEIDALPPERQEAIEKQIAERMQQRAELQAAEEREEKAAGVSVGAADPQEQAALLS
ncbi:hypothetical protein [Pseudomonas sp. SO81]|uniref:hypothetical protein n=1 Tax=Pseudomonas sp. SO81 TaxID=2983246 RepID=UPI0025A49A76|nr:hypothetical protein [Pseudomonas sp. SO81]WJN59875.1 hypothetical protein OH686_14060 [Pseudomonas sp. SO81]